MVAQRSLAESCRGAVTYKLAERPDEFRSAFQLVYQNYLQAGLICPNPLRLRVTPWHLLPTTKVGVGLRGPNVICTASLVADGALGIPMEAVFPEEIEERRQRGLQFAEVSCLADQRDQGQHSFSMLSRLFQWIAQSSRRRGIDFLLIAVHPHHGRFYERFLGFQPIGGIRHYDAVRGHPALPLELNLPRLAVHHPRAYRILFENAFPADALSPKSPVNRIPTSLARAVRYYGTLVPREADLAPTAAEVMCV